MNEINEFSVPCFAFNLKSAKSKQTLYLSFNTISTYKTNKLKTSFI